MHAYIADMDAARREAPADIKWPELDGHHYGIPVPIVPLGSPGCLPSEGEAFAEAVDATVRRAVERVLGVSFHPSTNGTDTNPVGASIRRMATVRAAAFSSCMNDILPSYAAAVGKAWGRPHAATTGHLNDADARVMEREAEAASGSQKELTAFVDQANNSRLQNEAVPLGNTVPSAELKDMMPDAELSLSAFNVVTGNCDPGA
eukprot:jgi/Tetstr1/432099/TSEL_021570.t1